MQSKPSTPAATTAAIGEHDPIEVAVVPEGQAWPPRRLLLYLSAALSTVFGLAVVTLEGRGREQRDRPLQHRRRDRPAQCRNGLRPLFSIHARTLCR